MSPELSPEIADLEIALRSSFAELSPPDLSVPQALLPDVHRRYRRDRQRLAATLISSLLILAAISAIAVEGLPFQRSAHRPMPAAPVQEGIVEHLQAVGVPTWFADYPPGPSSTGVRGYSLDGSPSFAVYDTKSEGLVGIPDGTTVHVIAMPDAQPVLPANSDYSHPDKLGYMSTLSPTAPALEFQESWPNTGQLFLICAWLPAKSVRLTYSLDGRVVASSNVIDGVGAVSLPHHENLPYDLGTLRAFDRGGHLLLSKTLR